MAFTFLMLFTLALFLRPHELYPSLSAIPFAKIFAIAGLLFFLSSKTYDAFHIIKGMESKLLMALVIFIVITTPFGLWPGGSFNKFKNDLIPVLLIFLLIAGVANNEEKINKLLWLMILSTFLVALLGIHDYLNGEMFPANRLYARVGLYGDPNDFAVTMAVMIPLSIYLLRANKSALKRLILLTVIVFFIINIVLTYSRTGIIAMVVISIGLLAKSRIKLKMSILILIMFSIIFILSPDRFKNRAASILILERSEDRSPEDRIIIFRQGIEIFLDNPILGVGLGNFPIAHGMKREVGHWKAAHNGYLEIAVELGIFGFVIFLGLLYCTIKNFRYLQKVWLTKTNSLETFSLVQMLEIAFWVYIVSTFFLSNQYNWMLFYIMSFAVALKFKGANKSLSKKS